MRMLFAQLITMGKWFGILWVVPIIVLFCTQRMIVTQALYIKIKDASDNVMNH